MVLECTWWTLVCTYLIPPRKHNKYTKYTRETQNKRLNQHPPNYTLRNPKYHLIRDYKAPNRGTLGALGSHGDCVPRSMYCNSGLDLQSAQHNGPTSQNRGYSQYKVHHFSLKDRMDHNIGAVYRMLFQSHMVKGPLFWASSWVLSRSRYSFSYAVRYAEVRAGRIAGESLEVEGISPGKVRRRPFEGALKVGRTLDMQ